MDDQNANQEDVELVGVASLRTQGLRGHEGEGAWALGETTAGHARVAICDLGHAKVGHLGSSAGINEHIIARHILVNHSFAMEVGQGEADAVSDVHLQVEGQWVGLQEASQDLVHELHEEDGL